MNKSINIEASHVLATQHEDETKRNAVCTIVLTIYVGCSLCVVYENSLHVYDIICLRTYIF